MRKLIILFGVICIVVIVGLGLYYSPKPQPVASTGGVQTMANPQRDDHSFMTYWLWYHWMTSGSRTNTIYVPQSRYPTEPAPSNWDAPAPTRSYSSYFNDSFSGWDNDDSYDSSYTDDSFDGWGSDSYDSYDSYSDDSFGGWDSYDSYDSYSDDSFSGWDSYDSGGYTDDSFSDW